VQTYLDGISALDEARLRKLLRDSIREGEKFLGH